MSYRSRLYNHRNAQSPEAVSDKPFFSKHHDTVEKNNQGAFFQAKLLINKPGDQYEQEADNVAHAVVNNNNALPVLRQQKISSIQRLATTPEEEKVSTHDQRMDRDKEKPFQRMAAEPEKDKLKGIQKMDEPEKEKKKSIQKKDDLKKEEEDKKKLTAVQTKHDGTAAGTASPQVTSKIESTAGKGHVLPKNTLHEMNASFGADFSNVRIHKDSEAAAMNKELNAQAFTHGNDIYFNEGKFDANSSQGKLLLAHELTHVVQQSAELPKSKIQRSKIDYRSLTWSDFMGKVPKKPKFDAATSSDITDFDSSLYPFKSLVAVPSGTIAHAGLKDIDCEKGMAKDKHSDEHPDKYKAFTVNIEADPASISVKSFMWQEKSWAKPWTFDKTAREVEAGSDIASCKASISKSFHKIDLNCHEQETKCKAAFKKNKDIVITLGGTKATNADECADLVEPCIKDGKSSVSFNTHNQNGATATATDLKDCDTTFKQQMVDVVLEDSSNTLLQHEQRHFDLTNQLAEQLTQELQSKAASFSEKDVEACTEAGALAAAKKVIAKQRTELDAIVAKFRKKLSAFQAQYDSETQHGKIEKAQEWWGENIDKGLPDKSGKGKF
jgi:hypothetical protein